MRWIVGGIITLLVGVAAYALYSAFSDPVFVTKIGAYAASVVIPIIVGAITKPASPEVLKKVNDHYREGTAVPNRQRPHPGEH